MLQRHRARLRVSFSEEEANMSERSGYQITPEAAKAREQYSVRYFIGPWAPGLVAVAALQPGERVLDLACGSGLIARLVAPQVGPTGQVTGLDINTAMLDVARSLPPPSGAAITWVEGSAVAMNLRDASFDAVLCQQGLQFFPDKPSALREIHRVLVPRGRLVLSVWKSPGAYNLAVAEALERYVNAETAKRFYASRNVPAADELQRLLDEAGFREAQVRPSTMNVRLPPMDSFLLGHISGMPIAEAVAAVSDEDRAALVAHVKAAMQPYADRDGVYFPDQINIATGRK
jgi:ubiquinone/menaquinone biosynthesis C-methylase UbiE